MTSMPASRSARAIIFAPRSCPSSPGLATTTRIFRLDIGRGVYSRAYPSLARALRCIATPSPSIRSPRIATVAASAPVSGRIEPESELEPEPELLEPDPVEPELELEPLPESVPPPPEPEPVSPEPEPPPPAAALTVIVPFMNGWGVQTYWNLPAVSKVCERLWPLPNVPVSKLPSSAVAECSTSSSFVQVTVSPASIVTDFGENAKSLIVTDAEAAALATTRRVFGRSCSRSSPRSCSARDSVAAGVGCCSVDVGACGPWAGVGAWVACDPGAGADPCCAWGAGEAAGGRSWAAGPRSAGAASLSPAPGAAGGGGSCH